MNANRSDTTVPQWGAQVIVPVKGCDKHSPFPTSYCSDCRAMFDAANPDYVRPYPDEIV